ncbi:MAG: GNAT family N-acetyltransferase, partial [Bacteroidota bacterium]
RRLRMMGEYETSGEYEPLYLPQYMKDVAAASSEFYAQLLLRKEIDVIDFHHFSSVSAVFEQIVQNLRAGGFYVRHEARSAVRLVLETPPDWPRYLDLLARHDRRNREKHERALFRNGAVLEMIPCAGNEQAFNDFAQLHTKAMAARSIGGHFVSKERYGDFLKMVTFGATDPEMSRWFFLKKGDERFAALLVFYTQDACCFYLSGRDPIHELSRLGPGIVLMNLAIKEAIRRGCRSVDFVEGGTAYKFTMGAKDLGFGRISITRRRFTSIVLMTYIVVVVFRQSSLWKEYLEPLDVRWRFRRLRHHKP